jgi:hypothetical protein
MLQLNGAICLEDLTNEQMQDYFASVNLGDFWESIKGSEKIVNFIRQPLFLAVTSLAYQQIDVEEWRNCNTEERAIDYLLGIYRLEMLTPKNGGLKNNQIRQTRNNLKTTVLKIQNYLIRISLISNPGQEICVEELSPEINSHISFWWHCAMSLFWLPILIFNSLSSDPFLQFIASWNFSNITSLIIGCILILIWSISIFIVNTIITGGIWLLLCYVFGGPLLIGFPENGSYGFFSWNPTKEDNFHYYMAPFGIFLIASICAIVYGTQAIFLLVSNGSLDANKYNEIMAFYKAYFFLIPFVLAPLIRTTFVNPLINMVKPIFKNKIILSIVSIIATGFISFILIYTYFKILVTFNVYGYFMIEIMKSSIFATLFCSVFAVCFGIIWGGGAELIKYLLLRFIIGFSGYFPWNITRFLDYCTDRLILQRVGNRYRFIHRLVQEHFANLEIQKE